MRILVPVVLVGALGAVAAIGSMSADKLPSVEEMCQLQQAAAVPKDPKVVFKPPKLSAHEEKEIRDARACVKSYALQFPGGLPALMAADHGELKKNLDDLKTAFSNPKAVRLNLDDPYSIRMAYIRAGWDREQVLLFGNYFMLHRLYENGDYPEIVSVVAGLRKEFDITARPVVWDELQDATYFSAGSLRNMISSIEYLAKVRMPGTTKESMDKTVIAYMKNRSNLMPLGNFSKNPDRTMFRGYCGSN